MCQKRQLKILICLLAPRGEITFQPDAETRHGDKGRKERSRQGKAGEVWRCLAFLAYAEAAMRKKLLAFKGAISSLRLPHDSDDGVASVFEEFQILSGCFETAKAIAQALLRLVRPALLFAESGRVMTEPAAAAAFLARGSMAAQRTPLST